MERILPSLTFVVSALALLLAGFQLVAGNRSLRVTIALTSLAVVGVCGWSSERIWGNSAAHHDGLPEAVVLWLPLLLSGFVTFRMSFRRTRVLGSGVTFECTRMSALVAWLAFLPVAFIDLSYV